MRRAFQVSTSRRGSKASNTSISSNADAIKAKIDSMRQAKPDYDVTNFYHTEGWCQLVARSSWFEKLTLSVIAVNALWISIDTDMNAAPLVLVAHPVFQFMEHAFCIYFTWEWTIRFWAFRRKRDGLRDFWFVFDSGMVFMMVAETWVMSTVLVVLGSASSGGLGGNTGILRMLRLMRLSRMARMAKLLRSFPELLLLVKGMAAATRSVCITLILLFLVTYVYSIAFRQLTDSSEVGRAYFPDMWSAMHTLWIKGTLLDSVGSVAVMLLEESVLLLLLFYSFVLLAALTIANMLIGVLCEVVSEVASAERESILMATVKGGFMDIMSTSGMQICETSMISRHEFAQIIENPRAVKLLTQVGVDPYSLLDLADFLFKEEDGDTEKCMTFADFMESIVSLRGSNALTVKDIVDVRKFLKAQFSSMNSKSQDRQTQVARSIQKTPCRSKSFSSDAWRSKSFSSLDSFAAPQMASGDPLPPADLPSPDLAHNHSSFRTRGTSRQRRLLMQVAEIQGILTIAQCKLEQFVNVMPSPPATAASPGISSDGSPAACGKRGFDGPTSFLALNSGRFGSITSSSTAATEMLPGMVREPPAAGPGAALRGKAPRRPAPARASSPASRLAELRGSLQQLGESMELGLEELHSIQTML